DSGFSTYTAQIDSQKLICINNPATGCGHLQLDIRDDPGHFRTPADRLAPQTDADVAVSAIAATINDSGMVLTPLAISSIAVLSPWALTEHRLSKS
ncbi:MAG: hypothetical protein KDA45_14385, partial [Planctomycetales bacterium]|nr:hypothetical protein [Planctomycetales bacterium]